jgi:hypothetical protein
MKSLPERFKASTNTIPKPPSSKLPKSASITSGLPYDSDDDPDFQAIAHLKIMKSSEDEDDEATNFEIGCDKEGRMKKLKISATVNDELKVSNFMKFKYVLCKHPQSCFWYQVKSVPQNFLKGAAMAGYASFLILILKSKRERGIPKSVFEILIEIYRT